MRFRSYKYLVKVLLLLVLHDNSWFTKWKSEVELTIVLHMNRCKNISITVASSRLSSHSSIRFAVSFLTSLRLHHFYSHPPNLIISQYSKYYSWLFKLFLTIHPQLVQASLSYNNISCFHKRYNVQKKKYSSK